MIPRRAVVGEATVVAVGRPSSVREIRAGTPEVGDLVAGATIRVTRADVAGT